MKYLKLYLFLALILGTFVLDMFFLACVFYIPDSFPVAYVIIGIVLGIPLVVVLNILVLGLAVKALE